MQYVSETAQTAAFSRKVLQALGFDCPPLNRVFKLKKSSRRKLQSSRSTIDSLVEWGEQPRPFCREEWGASPGKFKNQGSLINELYSLVCFAPVTDFVDRHCTLINKG